MSAAKRADPDAQRGFGNAMKTIYPPELAAQASFDALVDKLNAVPGSNRKAVQ